MTAQKSVVIVGVNGRIGRVMRRELGGVYGVLRLADLSPPLDMTANEEFHRVDIRQKAMLEPAFAGMDVVVLFAAQSQEADWETILATNIQGVYNVFEAAHACGVKRIVFASSHHAVGFYRRNRRLDPAVAPRPDSRYGVSKVFGEALGRFYADKFALSVACIRIGVCRPKPEIARHLSIWISERDLAQLICRSIDAPPFGFLMLYGVSANPRSFWDNPDALRIGYQPQDSAEAFAEAFRDEAVEEPASALFQGGHYCLNEFDGDLATID